MRNRAEKRRKKRNKWTDGRGVVWSCRCQKAMQTPNLTHTMKPFSVIITRSSSPTDGTNGWHGADFATRREALAYAAAELAKGSERAAVIQHTRSGQRRIANIAA